MICLIRKVPLLPTPEERVRQAILSQLIELGYSPGLIGVELSLSSLPHLAGQKLPKRRADIIIFCKSTHLPYILIECKAHPLTDETVRQAIGYNFFVQASYLTLANASEIRTGIFNGQWVFSPGLPSPKMSEFE